ncbi:substrate-binding periplasmic protein [Roseitranquillus sediminis]|uniref:substrate-binding periplasmic protein n=1 Tax=Roseitranquillus sediminis TaxID=2809051 RepID=UPI001D0C0EDE|nr:transporter substrate-binding domain-containing protein [Roseitranquillus sediminis]MBM9595951.1 transporter substrate-binding domain-containing protein [Roseitranquillus sediminis]
MTIVVCGALLLAVSYLPADTSLGQVRSTGRLTACTPTSYPPLVTGDPAAPGFDIEVLSEIAQRLGLRLSVNPNPAIGRDFNPRSWRVTRAQCQILAGGVVLAPSVQSFLDTVPSQLETGWAFGFPAGTFNLAGADVGVLAQIAGLDRIALSRWLREIGATPHVVQDEAALVKGLRTGTFDAAIGEALMIGRLGDQHGWEVAWAPEKFERYRLGFGLWRGDLTLLQAVEQTLDAMRRDGTLDALLDEYGLRPIEAVYGAAAS